MATAPKPLHQRCGEAAEAIFLGDTIFSDKVHGLLIEASVEIVRLSARLEQAGLAAVCGEDTPAAEHCPAGCGTRRVDFMGLCNRVVCPWKGHR